jgi:hypothetical protein
VCGQPLVIGGVFCGAGVQRGMIMRSRPRVSRPMVMLDQVRGGVDLHFERAEVAAEKSAGGEPALFLIAGNRRSEVGRAVAHRSELPFAELLNLLCIFTSDGKPINAANPWWRPTCLGRHNDSL